MSPVGPATLQLDERGFVERCTPAAAELLGPADPAQVDGSPLADWLDPEGRAWVDAIPLVGTIGLDERVVRTARGRPVRLHPCGDGRVLVLDAHRERTLATERERALAEAAVLELVPLLRRELNDPMSIVLGRLELLDELRGEGVDGHRRHLTVALQHARRIANTLHLLRMVGRAPPACAPAVELSGALSAALAEVGGAVRVHRLQVRPVHVATDPEVLGQGLVALLDRLADRAGPGGRLSIVATESVGRVQLALSMDTATERPEPDWNGAIEPRHELGVAGVALARFGVQSELCRDGAGLCYKLCMPRAADLEAAAQPPTHRREVWGIGVDDPGEILARALGRSGCRWRSFTDAEQAMRELRHRAPFALLTGLALPGRSGLALLEAVARLQPDLLSHCGLVAREPVEDLPPGVKAHALPLDPDAVLRSLGLGAAG